MPPMKKSSLISLVGALTVGIGGCDSSPHYPYQYQGKIGEDKVMSEKLSYWGSSPHHFLKITKPDGRIITYVDSWGNDFKLDYVEITVDDKTQVYRATNKVGKPVIDEAQKQFDRWLQTIEETKVNEGLKNLK